MVRGWRWSFATSGGGYPLLRISARFLKMDHTKLLVGFRTIDGQAILCKNPQRPSRPQAWAFVEFDRQVTIDEAEARIRETLA